jgi:hypothetical protein
MEVTMTRTTSKHDGKGVVSGVWKFSEKISPEVLVALAKEWAFADTNGDYIDLHVRKCSKSQHGIGFKIILQQDSEDISREEYEKFFNRMTDLLRRKFGNDFAGWDVSSFTHIII